MNGGECSILTSGLPAYSGDLEIVTFGDGRGWGCGDTVNRGLGGYPLDPAEFGAIPAGSSGSVGRFRLGTVFIRYNVPRSGRSSGKSSSVSNPGVVFPLKPLGEDDDRGSR